MKRRFQQRGIDVVVDESGDMVDLRLNGVPPESLPAMAGAD